MPDPSGQAAVPPDGHGFYPPPAAPPAAVPAYPPPATPHPAAGYTFRPVPLLRPGGVRAAAIMGWIEGGLLFLSAPLLAFVSFLSGSLAHEGAGPTPEGWLLVAAALNLVGGALLLVAGSLVVSGRAVGRPLHAGAVVVLVAASVAWLSQGSATTWIPAVAFLVMPVISIALLTRPPVNAWFASLRRPTAGG